MSKHRQDGIDFSLVSTFFYPVTKADCTCKVWGVQFKAGIPCPKHDPITYPARARHRGQVRIP